MNLQEVYNQIADLLERENVRLDTSTSIPSLERMKDNIEQCGGRTVERLWFDDAERVRSRK